MITTYYEIIPCVGNAGYGMVKGGRLILIGDEIRKKDLPKISIRNGEIVGNPKGYTFLKIKDPEEKGLVEKL